MSDNSNKFYDKYNLFGMPYNANSSEVMDTLVCTSLLNDDNSLSSSWAISVAQQRS
jgi:hypothetical protein